MVNLSWFCPVVAGGYRRVLLYRLVFLASTIWAIT
jgi:hypothetical protein